MIFLILKFSIWNIIIAINIVKIGWIWEVAPNASSKLDKKYRKNISINDEIMVKPNLSDCFNPFTNEDAKYTRAKINKGIKTKLYKCILKSKAEYPNSSKKFIKVTNLQIDIDDGDDRLSPISSKLILVLYSRYSL